MGPLTYFYNKWTYLDQFTLLLLTITVIMDFSNVEPHIQRPFFAVSVFVLWIKTLYYLRVFRSLGYLSSMLLEVINDMS